MDDRIGYASGKGWRVVVLGKNLLDTDDWTNAVGSSDSAARLAGMPVTYGVTFGFAFH